MPNSKSSAIQRATSGKLEWVHVSSTNKRTIDELRREFGYQAMDLQAALPPLQRPKLVVRDNYIFIILLYPVFDHQTRTVYSSEIDFFLSANQLVTINADGLKPVMELFNACRNTDARQIAKNNLCMVGDAVHLLYSILSDLLESVSPMLLHLSVDIDEIERRLFQDYEKNLIQELLRVKTNVVNVRKAMQGHKTVIRQLIRSSQDRFPIHELESYFEHLIEQTKEIWDTLEMQRDTINALHETNASLIDFRINEIMKTLTVFSVIVFPLALLAGIFGMNAKNMPFVDDPYGFWIILGLMFTAGFIMLLVFKKKRWI